MLAAVFYRALNFSTLYNILVESARSSAAVGLVIGGALILNYVASENIPSLLAQHLVGLDIDPLLFLLGVNLLLLLLGCVLDATTIILVVIPLFTNLLRVGYRPRALWGRCNRKLHDRVNYSAVRYVTVCTKCSNTYSIIRNHP